MKKLIVITLILSMILVLFSSCAKDKENAPDATSATIFSPINAYSLPYKTIEELTGYATDIFEGKITGISFKVMNTAAEKELYPELTMIYAVYEVEVTKTYKGEEKQRQIFTVRGGIPNYRVEEQVEALKAANAYNGFVSYWESKPHPNIGDSYLFLTKEKSEEHIPLVNDNQSLVPLNDEPVRCGLKYSDIVAYLENGEAKAE